MKTKTTITNHVADIYKWLDTQTANYNCKTCGQCCNFHAFDHRLYVTTPEMIYFTEKLNTPLKQPTSDKCPYNENNLCTVHPHRFAACRIFCCSADKDFQSQLSEQTLKKLKAICRDFQIPYQYMDLLSALK